MFLHSYIIDISTVSIIFRNFLNKILKCDGDIEKCFFLTKNCAKVLILIDTYCHSGIAQGVIHNLKV